MLSENNKDHQALWIAFKERNLLQKLDFTLNHINLSSKEIEDASGETLQRAAQDAEKGSPSAKRYIIDVPPVHEDFPQFANKQSKIYPLPISHENQCTILGTASNLDLFTGEFGLNNERQTEKQKLLPKDKDYDLEKAYERYAFLKKYEKHKDKQKQYELILRGQCNSTNEQLEDESEADVFVQVSDDDSSDDAIQE